jgi:hypothetical protein
MNLTSDLPRRLRSPSQWRRKSKSGFVRADCKLGSAREFDETRILGCFLKNEEFGLGGCHTLSLEQ